MPRTLSPLFSTLMRMLCAVCSTTTATALPIIIHYSVIMATNADTKDLFNVQIGRVSRVSLAYGPQGLSKGVATIQFHQKGDAKKAYDRYDGKLIDNTRRLKVRTPPDPSRFKLEDTLLPTRSSGWTALTSVD